MMRSARRPAAPVGQQGPPARAAASLWGLRAARGPLLLTTGTAFTALDPERKP